MQRALPDRAVAVVRDGDGTPRRVSPLEMTADGTRKAEPVRPQNALHLGGGHRLHRAEPFVPSKSISSVTSARASRNSGKVSASVKQLSCPRTVAQ